MEAWDRAKRDAEVVTGEQGGRGAQATKRTEGRTGAATNLAAIIRIRERTYVGGAECPTNERRSNRDTRAIGGTA